MSYLFADDFEGFSGGLRENCSRHPSEQIVSDCGMFDAPCGACEAEGEAFSQWAELFLTLPVACVWDLSPLAATCRSTDEALTCLTAEGWEAYCEAVMRAYDDEASIPF